MKEIIVIGDSYLDVIQLGKLEEGDFNTLNEKRCIRGTKLIAANIDTAIDRTNTKLIAITPEDYLVFRNYKQIAVSNNTLINEKLIKDVVLDRNYFVNKTKSFSLDNKFRTLVLCDYVLGALDEPTNINLFQNLAKISYDILIVDSPYGTIDPHYLQLGNLRILYTETSDNASHPYWNYDYIIELDKDRNARILPGPWSKDYGIEESFITCFQNKLIDDTGCRETFIAALATFLNEFVQNDKELLTVNIKIIEQAVLTALQNSFKVGQIHNTI